MKNPVTRAEIEPVTSRFVAQHLKHCATAVSQRSDGTGVYFAGVKRPGREGNHSIPPKSEFQNEWSTVSTVHTPS